MKNQPTDTSVKAVAQPNDSQRQQGASDQGSDHDSGLDNVAPAGPMMW
jgi:hypothetical protein